MTLVRQPGKSPPVKVANKWRQHMERHLKFQEGAAIKIKQFKQKPHPRGARALIEEQRAEELARNGPRPRLPFEEPEPAPLWG